MKGGRTEEYLREILVNIFQRLMKKCHIRETVNFKQNEYNPWTNAKWSSKEKEKNFKC